MELSPNQSKKPKKKNFASFNLAAAFKQLKIARLSSWELEVQSVTPRDFFQQRMAKLRRFFDLRSFSESKKLTIDAILEEGLEGSQRLKVWKGAGLKSDALNGNVDYLVADNKDYLEAPLLCIVEASEQKNDFERGLAQCLVEMQACQWNNQQIGKIIDVQGIVTNGDSWRFYQLTRSGQVYETLPYAIGDLATILGWLRYLFQLCEQNLS